MIKMVFLCRKRPDLSDDEFHRYWRETHAPVAAKIPGLRKYVQKHAVAPGDGERPAYDGLAEMWFEDGSSFETSEFDEAVADTKNFLDVDRSPGFAVDDVEIV